VRQLETLTPAFAAFDRLCPAGTGPVGVAVSGGSDSLALLLLSHDWALARGRDLIAFTFDHGLRDASAGEAARVGEICRALGRRHQTLLWDAPINRQSAARRARHAALARALKAQGGAVLLTGHTADDQAETFLMRARQGSTWYGLAGMQAVSPSPVWPEGEGVRIARPLLTARRSDLRHVLTSRGAGWVDDPTNDNPLYERVRMRQLLAASPGLYLQISRCLADLTGLRAVEDVRLGRWLRDHVRVSGTVLILADMTMLGPESAARGLGILIQGVTGRETPPRRENLQSLADRLQSPRAFAGATLGGAKVSRQGAIVHLVPEAGLDGPDPLLIRRLADLRDLLVGQA
jgi:tRNA(Ile)-lysidine synthase